MNAKVVCFGSAKGGAGKTVVTATIGSFLGALGKQVLLIDTDASTNGLSLLFIKEVAAAGGTHEGPDRPFGLFEGDAKTTSIARLSVAPGVDIIPATYQFIDTERVLPEYFGERLIQVIKGFREKYDYILIDAQAGSDVFASIAMSKRISDIVVLVSEYDPMSAAGIERLKGLMRDDLTYARTWVLLNKILPEFAKNFGDFLEVARYLSPIPWDADVVRAYARRRLALDVERGNSFTVAIVQTVRSLFGDDIESDIREWLVNRADVIRQPIAQQYNDLERELQSIIRLSAEADQRQRMREARQKTILAMVGAISAATAVLAIGRYSDGLNALNLRPWSLVALLVSGVATVLAVVQGFRGLAISDRSVNLLLEQSKLERRRLALEQSLAKLESLRAADAEALLRMQHTPPRAP
jgi:cellulose biosynthesis protein BcsQ